MDVMNALADESVLLILLFYIFILFVAGPQKEVFPKAARASGLLHSGAGVPKAMG